MHEHVSVVKVPAEDREGIGTPASVDVGGYELPNMDGRN